MTKGFATAVAVLALAAAGAGAQGPSPYPSYPQPVPGGAAAGPAINEPMPIGPVDGGGDGQPAAAPEPYGVPSLPSNTPGAWDPPPPREKPGWSIGGEYLYYWIHKPLPPLVTSSTSGAPGILGQPGTYTIFGGDHPEWEQHQGARVTWTSWFDLAPMGMEWRASWLAERNYGFSGSSNSIGFPALSRPVVDALNGEETVENVSLPGAFAGGVQVRSRTFYWDGEANLLFQLDPSCAYPNFFIGARYADLDEHLDIDQVSNTLPAGVIGSSGDFFGPPASAAISDSFHTRNQFYGGQIGTQGQLDGSKLFLKLRGAVAVGYTHQEANTYGATTLNQSDGTVQQFSGGVLALQSNSGHFSRNVVSVLPTAEITLGCHVTSFMDAFIGYNVLYWSDVVRPGDVVDRTVNPTQLPTSVQSVGFSGPARPQPFHHDSDLWMHGINAGLALHY